LLLPAGAVAQEAGDLDTSFGVGGKVITDFSGGNDEAQAVALQPDGKIVVAGNTTSNPATGLVEFAVARYLPDGTLDTTFGDDGLVTTGFGVIFGLAQAVAVQPDGKIVAAGYIVDPPTGVSARALARYLPDGTLDTTFSGDGKLTTDQAGQVFAILLQPDGKIVAAGGLVLARYHPDGTLDTTFGDDGQVTVDFGEILAAALQPDGKIVAAGPVFNSSAGQYEFALARYLPDGTLDSTFDGDGRVTTDVGGSGFARAVALQADGKIVAAGSIAFDVAPFHVDFALARYLPDGTLDTTFGGDGLVTTDFGGILSEAFDVALQPDGKIVAAGYAFFSVFALARYLPDGTLDTTFGGDGLVTTAFGAAGAAKGLVIQPQDGRLVAVGSSSATIGEGSLDFALARYESGLVLGVGPPTNKEECKHDGWRNFNVPRDFKNQGDCIQFVNTGK